VGLKRYLDLAPLVVAALAPTTALYHTGLRGTHPWLARQLPALGLEYPYTCIGVPDGPPGLKAAFLVERCAQALAGQCLCSLLLLLLLLAVSPQRPNTNRASRVRMALATFLVSTLSFSTWVATCTVGLLAQDF
jgi:hypothetical protein